ncbi:hypothetical protein [Lentzea waywayandensis]|uniref:hypothetical protein n=1 Tax=Lentzea waywayandensis TaxID=84724 RepID=UPI001160B153|nr:hypothetical protein [Lentzea waywayandensis]
MTTELDETSLRQLRVNAVEKLDNAVCTALTDIEAERAREILNEALDGCAAIDAEVQPHVLASVQAAGEHLGHGERMEARTLLTVAHRLLARLPAVIMRDSSPVIAGNRQRWTSSTK